MRRIVRGATFECVIARVLALGFAATVAGSSPRVAFEHLAPAI